MLNILHISDLHFTSEAKGLRRDYSHAAAKAILRLSEDLKRQGVLGSSVAVVITGDLVQSGSAPPPGRDSDFDGVQKHFLEPLMDILSISPDRVFIVPGNHEMDRMAVEAKDFQSFYSKTSEAELNSQLQYKLSSYFNFIEKNNYNSVKSHSPRIVKFKIDGQMIVCFNGLAGSYSRNGFGDKGELFVLNTEFASELHGIDDFSIIVTHHPLSWYCDECETRLREFLSSKRCRLMTGHIHSEALGEVKTDKGAFLTLQAGASSETGDIAFSVSVAWLPPSNSAAVRQYNYDAPNGEFLLTLAEHTKVAPDAASTFLRRSEAFYEPSDLMAVSSEAVRLCAAELFELSATKPEAYVPPDLMHFREDQFSGRRVKIEDLLEDDASIILSGYELSGKSSLLTYLCYRANQNVSTAGGHVGLPIDFREMEKSDNIQTFLMRRLSELGVASAQAEYLFSIGRVRLYVDNFDAHERGAVRRFLAACKNFPLIRWTAVARGSERFMPSRAPSDLQDAGISYYQLSEISLPTVLRMIDGHQSGNDIEKPRAIVQRVFQSIQNLSAPRTMFYVRSLLDIFLNDASVEPLNRYLLIENLISERIRCAHRDIFPNQPVDMQMLEAFIGLLSHDLFIRKVSFFTKAELLTLAEAFIGRKGLQRKRFDPEKVLEVLTESRVLRSYESGYGFVILSVEDYFLAKHMSHDEAFRALVLSPDGLLTLPTAAEFYIAQNPNDRPRIDQIFSIIDAFEREVAPIIAEIDELAIHAIRTAAPGLDCKLQDDLLDEIAEVDQADEPSMISFPDPERLGDTSRVRYSVEERGAVLLQLGASILGVTRTLDQVDRIAIFDRLRSLLLTCVKGIPLLAQHLADGHEIRLRGVTVRAEYIGKLAVQDDRFYIILRGMLYNIFKQFATWAGSPSFFVSAASLRTLERDEIVAAALFAQNIEADLPEAIHVIDNVSDKCESMILKEIVARLYLDALTLVPLERADESRAVDALVDLAASLNPPKSSSSEQMRIHKDRLRRQFNEDIGVNTYIGRRLKRPKAIGPLN